MNSKDTWITILIQHQANENRAYSHSFKVSCLKEFKVTRKFFFPFLYKQWNVVSF